MRSGIVGVVLLLACLLMAVSVFAQDPLSGTWKGDWGPNPSDRNRVTVVLKWDGKTLTGMVNPDNGAVQIQKGTFDPKTGTVHMEATTPGRGGSPYHYMIDGKLNKGTISGSWNHEAVKGDFKITK